jgi:hypothetical protein
MIGSRFTFSVSICQRAISPRWPDTARAYLPGAHEISGHPAENSFRDGRQGQYGLPKTNFAG